MSLVKIIKSELPNTKPHPYKRPNPSNIAQCTALLWYLVKRYDELLSIDGDTQLLFEDGRVQEKAMIDLCQKYGHVLIINNNEFVATMIGKHRAVGKPDGLVEGLEDKKHPMIEFKAMASHLFHEFRLLGIKVAAPNYYAQVQVTLQACKDTWPTLDIPYAILFAKEKSTADIHDEIIPYDDGAIADIEEILNQREDILREDEPPSRPYERGSYRCNTCAARDMCWGPPQTKKTVFAKDLPNYQELLEAAKEFIELVHKDRDAKKALKARKTLFDNSLKAAKASEIIIQIEPGTLVAPYIRVLEAQIYIDEDVLIMDYPKIAATVAREKDVTQFRQRIVEGGQTIRT